MRDLRPSFIFVSIATFAVVNTTINSQQAMALPHATGLPVQITRTLNSQFPGWQAFSETDGCDVSYSKALVSGSFNQDITPDYVVRLRWRGQGRIIAFLSNGQAYNQLVLERGSFSEIRNQGLSLARRGTRLSVMVNESGRRQTMTTAHDTPLGGTCEASSYAYFFEGRSFKRAFMSD